MFRYFLILFSTICVRSFAQSEVRLLDFDLTIDQMSNLRCKPSTSNHTIHPGLDLTLEELQGLSVQKIVKATSIIQPGFDLTLEELTELNVKATKQTIEPDFDTPINTLAKLSLKKEYLIDDHIDFPFDLPLETLMKLSILD